MPFLTKLKKVEKKTIPLFRSAPKVNWVYSRPGPIRKPSFVDIHSVVSLQYWSQTNRQTKKRKKNTSSLEEVTTAVLH